MSSKNTNALKSQTAQKELDDAIAKLTVTGDNVSDVVGSMPDSMSQISSTEAVATEYATDDIPEKGIEQIQKEEADIAEKPKYNIEEYRKDFLQFQRDLAIQGAMTVVVPEVVHKEMKKILFFLAPRVPLNSYVANVLLRHLEDNKGLLSEAMRKTIEENGMLL